MEKKNSSYVCYSTDNYAAIRARESERNGNGKPDRRPKTDWSRDDVKHVLHAAENGCVSAMYEMAQRLFNGRSVEMNREDAMGWCLEAAGHGHAPALNMLGYCCATGTGFAYNPRMAVCCFAKASLKYTRAAYNLGVCYLVGIGVSCDTSTAKHLLAHAAKTIPAAALLLGRCCLEEIGFDPDDAEEADFIAFADMFCMYGDRLSKEEIKEIKELARQRRGRLLAA